MNTLRLVMKPQPFFYRKKMNTLQLVNKQKIYYNRKLSTRHMFPFPPLPFNGIISEVSQCWKKKYAHEAESFLLIITTNFLRHHLTEARIKIVITLKCVLYSLFCSVKFLTNHSEYRTKQNRKKQKF